MSWKEIMNDFLEKMEEREANGKDLFPNVRNRNFEDMENTDANTRR